MRICATTARRASAFFRSLISTITTRPSDSTAIEVGVAGPDRDLPPKNRYRRVAREGEKARRALDQVVELLFAWKAGRQKWPPFVFLLTPNRGHGRDGTARQPRGPTHRPAGRHDCNLRSRGAAVGSTRPPKAGGPSRMTSSCMLTWQARQVTAGDSR